MELFPLIHDLALILGVASVFALVFQRIHQPLVLGYLLAGLIIGPYTPSTPMVLDVPSIKIWAELGVIFLMFTLGLEFSFKKLTRVGMTAGFTASFEAVLMIALGYGVGRALSWSARDSLFLGAMLSISSTTIIIKALDELNLKKKRFAELIFGILIVEDMLAILILVGLSTFFTNSQFSAFSLISSAAKLVMVIGSWFLAGYFIIPRFINYVGRIGSPETLTLLSIGLCLSLVVIAHQFHYSAALGAFIMGSILAESSESKRIEELMRPLKDLFASVFFVSVGMLLNPTVILQHLGTILIISAVTLVGKVTATTLGALITGQTLRTSIQVGFGLAQIGEFSFIIAGLGLSLGVTSDFIYPIGVAVSLITTFTTPYLIRYSHSVATRIETGLPEWVQAMLSKYVVWQQQRKGDLVIMRALYFKVLRWVLNGILVTAIFLLIGYFSKPVLEPAFHNPFWLGLTQWCASIILAAPFIWAMTVAFVDTPTEAQDQKDDPEKRLLPEGAVLFIGRILTLIWIGALSLEFFSLGYTLLFMSLLFLLVFIFQLRQLETSYRWFESQFLSVLKSSELNAEELSHTETESAGKWLSHLGHFPGQALRNLRLEPNSPLIGKLIRTSGIREGFGAVIVGIEHDGQRIINPEADLTLSLGDTLWVVGKTDRLEALGKSLTQGSAHDTR